MNADKRWQQVMKTTMHEGNSRLSLQEEFRLILWKRSTGKPEHGCLCHKWIKLELTQVQYCSSHDNAKSTCYCRKMQYTFAITSCFYEHSVTSWTMHWLRSAISNANAYCHAEFLIEQGTCSSLNVRMQDLFINKPNNRYNLRNIKDFYSVRCNTERFKNSFIPSIC